MNKVTIKDLDLKNKKVLIRVDFNVPMENGVITDDNRIKEALQTINYAISKGASVILMSHLGRPDGKPNDKYSLKPVAERLSLLLDTPVKFSKDTVGDDAKKLAKNLKSGEVLLLENLRFSEKEEANDDEFSKELAGLADVFIFDAFGTAHRKHASTYGVTKHLPNAIGFLIEKELEMITKNIENPKRPFVAILGGSKVSDKIKVIENLLDKVDSLIIGGAMSYTFLKASGVNIGKSLVEDDYLQFAKDILLKARDNNKTIYLPIDHITANDIKNPTKIINTVGIDMPSGFMGVDIGKKTRKLFTKVVKDSGLVIWNGPMGVFEVKPFDKGTNKLIKAVAKSKAISIVGGGDTASAVINMGYKNKFTHISTGGGASLKLIEGASLKAIDAINNK